jgi:threonine dehydratase
MTMDFTPPVPTDTLLAAASIAGHVVRTPMLRNTALDRATGATILVKPEVLQRTGSFKLRGATNALLRLTPEQRAAGIVTYSSGNHGQAIACAAAALGATATIVMPADAPAIKRDATAAWGANIVTYDRLRDDREAIGRKIQAETGATLVPPYDHPDVIAGQGTLALELAADAKEAGLALDILFVPAGGGGLIAGCALGLAAVSPATKIYAVEPQGWDDTGRSLRSGQRERNDMQGSTLCDALLAPMPGALTFPINQKHLAGGLTVTDEEVHAAQAFAARHLKLVVEPGGAVALAALLAEKIDTAGKTVGIVLSGGNADI